MVKAPEDLDRLVGLLRGFRATQAVYVVAKLGIADRLGAGPATAAQLASEVGAHEDSLRRVMRLGSFYGLFQEVEGGRFQLTPLGGLLASSAQDSVRPLALMVGEIQYEAWGELLHSVLTGEPALEHIHGAPLFEYLARNPERQAVFDAAMSVGVKARPSRLAQVIDFSNAQLLIDVGGGNGSMTALLLEAHPHLRAIVFDQPHVLEAADRYLAAAGLRDRCDLVPGSFFDSVPPDGDVYLLSNIVHDWDDRRARRILQNCAAAMRPDAAMLLVETVLAEHGHPTPAVVADVNMLIQLTGRERTEGEFRSLLGDAGLRLAAITALSWDGESALEARADQPLS